MKKMTLSHHHEKMTLSLVSLAVPCTEGFLSIIFFNFEKIC